MVQQFRLCLNLVLLLVLSVSLTPAFCSIAAVAAAPALHLNTIDVPQALGSATMQQASCVTGNIGPHGLHNSVADVGLCMQQETRGAAPEIQGLLSKEVGASSFRWWVLVPEKTLVGRQ